MATEITLDSYTALLAAGEFAWQENNRYYADFDIVEDDGLIISTPTYKLYKYLYGEYDETQFPGDIPFNIHGLRKIETINFGLRSLSLYTDPENETDEVVKVEYTFVKDPGLPTMNYRDRIISLKLSDDTWSTETKRIRKYYTSNFQKEEEIEYRRHNVIEQLKSIADDLGIHEYIIQLFDLYHQESYKYVAGGSLDLRDAINADTTLPWLNENLPNGYPARQTIANYCVIGTDLDV